MILRSLILIKLRNFSGVIRATTEEIAKFTFLFAHTLVHLKLFMSPLLFKKIISP